MASFILSAFADEAGSSLSEQIAALKRNQIDYIEPRNIGGKGILDLSEEELFSVKSELDRNNIKVNSLGSPIGKVSIDCDFDEYMELFRRAIRACEILDTSFMRIFSFFTESHPLREVRDEVIRRLTYMCDIASSHGITLCHENEARIYGMMPKEVGDILRSVPKLGGILDPANYILAGANVCVGFENTQDSFRYMHIKDAIFQTQEVVPAGEGEGKIAEMLNRVDSLTDGDVFLTLEPHLHIFDAYKSIDEHELRGRYSFNSNSEAFDFAADSLKKLLTSAGYKKDGMNQWKR